MSAKYFLLNQIFENKYLLHFLFATNSRKLTIGAAAVEQLFDKNKE
jgi:hypothetical protein